MKRLLEMSEEARSIAIRNLSPGKPDLAEIILRNISIEGIPLFWDDTGGGYWSFANGSDIFSLQTKILNTSVSFMYEYWAPLWTAVFDKLNLRFVDKQVYRPMIYKAVGKAFCELEDTAFISFVEDINLRDFLLPKSILGATLRRRECKEYYFDENYILQVREETTSQRYYGLYSEGLWALGRKVNCNIWAKAMSATTEGMSADEFIDIYLSSSLGLGEGWSFVERLCTKIEKPSIERTPENTNKNSFDRIRVVVCLNATMHSSVKDLLRCIRENRDQIDELVLRRIEESKAFQKFEVPINILKLSSLQFAGDYTLEYIFEVKDSI